ncbi:murein transglycosylase, partial [Micromonospora zamorensis]
MVDGEDDTRVQPLRPAAPLDGPLEGSGAAPDPVRAVPRPRRPWLSGRSGAGPTTPAATPAPTAPGAGPTAKVEATTVADPKTADATVEDAKADAVADDAKATADPAKTMVDGVPVVPASDPARRRRVPFAHAIRLEPRRAAASAAHATRAWARRPSGRLTLPGVFLLALVAATAAAGALLVPATFRAPRPVAADSS